MLFASVEYGFRTIAVRFRWSHHRLMVITHTVKSIGLTDERAEKLKPADIDNRVRYDRYEF